MTSNERRRRRARSSRSRISRSSRCASRSITSPARSGVDDAVGEPLGVAADRGQRRLQLVADREEERALGVLGAVQLLRELVERGRELAELGRALDRKGIGALALREAAARLGDPGDRPGDRAREQEGDDGREHGADQRGEREADEERLPVVRLVARRAEEHDRVAAAESRGVQERLAADVDGAVRASRPSGASAAAVSGRRSSACAGVRIARRSCSVARKRPSVVSPRGSGFAACWATIRSTCRSSALRASLVERAPGERRADREHHDRRDGERRGDADEQARPQRARAVQRGSRRRPCTRSRGPSGSGRVGRASSAAARRGRRRCACRPGTRGPTRARAAARATSRCPGARAGRRAGRTPCPVSSTSLAGDGDRAAGVLEHDVSDGDETVRRPRARPAAARRAPAPRARAARTASSRSRPLRARAR